MSFNTVTLDGSKATVAKIGHGLMMMTWCPNPIPDEQAFEAIKSGIDALPQGVKMFLNSGAFYANDFGTANLQLVSRFFEKYPEYADRTFLSVKGAHNRETHSPDCSPEYLRRSVDEINETLRGKKRLDLFEPARIDPKVQVEDIVRTLAELVAEGKFDHIGLSECSAQTLRRASAVHRITAVEIEVSPWSYEEETKKVIATAKELGVAVAAYSPLGRGFLTGKITKTDDLDKNDMRRRYTRFQDEAISHNMAIVDGLKSIAEKKGVPVAQLCLAWVSSLGAHVIPIPGSSHKTRVLENLAAGNISLTSQELEDILRVLEAHPVQGDRYFGNNAAILLWG